MPTSVVRPPSEQACVPQSAGMPSCNRTGPIREVARAKLRRFLAAYWLRPENALWMALRSAAQARSPMARPSADLSCGDGVYSFLHAGGAFDECFDVFQFVSGLQGVAERHTDMFDCCPEGYRPPIAAHPRQRIDVGTDLKPSMLAKANALGLYDRLLQLDHNEPLPLPRHVFETVYCNSAYWVRNIEPFLAEIARILRRGGTAILHVKLDAMRHYTLERHREVLGDRFLDIIGRGRHETWPSLADRATWEKRFAAAGLSIVEATAFVTQTHARLWDIGLRPLAPLLVRMSNGLAPPDRAAIKRDWIDLVEQLLQPLCDPNFDPAVYGGEAAEIQYLLTPA